METKHLYETVTEALVDLSLRGYTTHFSLHAHKDCLICKQTTRLLSPNDFEIDEVYRIEGETDPDEEMVVFALTAPRYAIKGVVVNTFGRYSDTMHSKIVEKLLAETQKEWN